jgi:hypothetical protein
MCMSVRIIIMFIVGVLCIQKNLMLKFLLSRFPFDLLFRYCISKVLF